MTHDHIREIAERAFYFWESEGRPHGKAIDHWLRAETELAVHPAPQMTTDDPKPSMPKYGKAKQGQTRL